MLGPGLAGQSAQPPTQSPLARSLSNTLPPFLRPKTNREPSLLNAHADADTGESTPTNDADEAQYFQALGFGALDVVCSLMFSQFEIIWI